MTGLRLRRKGRRVKYYPVSISGAQRKAKKKQILCDLCASAVIINYPIEAKKCVTDYLGAKWGHP